MVGDSPLGYVIAEGDAATFAQLLGKVCNDVFAAAELGVFTDKAR